MRPLGDHLTVTGEHDGLRRVRWDVHRDLATAIVVIESLGDEPFQLSGRHRAI